MDFIIKEKKNAETAEYPQNTQTDWECGDDANYVVYATIPARFYFLKNAIEHRVIARESGVDDTPTGSVPEWTWGASKKAFSEA